LKASLKPIDLLMRVAERLGPDCDRVVFIGGTTVSLLVVDPAIAATRVTDDVDCIVQVEKLSEYYDFVHHLENSGFSPDQNGPICRYNIGGLKVDIMPTQPEVIGFANRWYQEGLENAVEVPIPSGAVIRILAAPYFIASKLEAFRDRGKNDYWASHDLEDIITVIDGRPAIVEEIRALNSQELKMYLSEQMEVLLASEKFLEALPGHLAPDSASQARRQIVLSRIREIAQSER
jgi:predicted nucleotidyltransferase